MNRRDFLLAAVSTAGLLGASGLLERSGAYASIVADASGHVYSRRNVYCMTAKSPEIVAYKAGISAMRALPATNGVSWLAQANIHGAFAPPAGMIANVCQHNQMFFLSWHRMYVYFFERIVRKQSGDSTFALPYWGYSSTGRRELPPMFRSPTTGNPLYDGTRNSSINAGTPMNPSLVDAGGALSQPLFWDFSNFVNGTPHGQVHGACGGNMGLFETAGQDPIFWLHHCNIDRLWEVWLDSGGGRVNPTTTPNWMTTSFNFYDENGATVSLTGAQIVDTACQLRYQYEGDVCVRRSFPPFPPGWWQRYSRLPIPPVGIAAHLDSLVTRVPLPDPIPVAQLQEPLRLGGRPVQTTLAISAEGRRRLEALSREAQAGGRINLVLENIQVTESPPVTFEIYINLPNDTRNPEYTDPHYVGNINLFGPSPRGAHGDKRENQIVPLTLPYLRLRDAKQWSDDSIRVTFVPRGVTERTDPVRALGRRTPVTIGRITLQIQ